MLPQVIALFYGLDHLWIVFLSTLLITSTGFLPIFNEMIRRKRDWNSEEEEDENEIESESIHIGFIP